MTVRLNITMEEELYEQLKAATPPKRISAFIAEAVKGKLRPGKRELNAAYRAASQEAWRKGLAEDWCVTETEHWPS